MITKILNPTIKEYLYVMRGCSYLTYCCIEEHYEPIHYTNNAGNSYLNTLKASGTQIQHHLAAGIVPSMMKHRVFGKSTIFKNS